MFTINDYVNVCLYALQDENYYKEKNLLMNQIVDSIWDFYIDDIKNNQNFHDSGLKNDILNLIDSEYKNEISTISLSTLCEINKNKNKNVIEFIKKVHDYNIIQKYTKLIPITDAQPTDNNYDYNIKFNIIISILLNTLKNDVPNFLLLTGLYPYYETLIIINKKISNVNDYMYHFGTESFIFNVPKMINKDNIYYFFNKNGVEFENITLVYETLKNITPFEYFLNAENGYVEIFNIIFQVIRAMFIAHKRYNFCHGNLMIENVIINKLNETLSIREDPDIQNVAEKYNFEYTFQNTSYVAYIYNYDYSQINLDKPYNIKDEQDNDIEVSRLNRYYYRAIDDMSSSIHDVFKFLLSLNMLCNKIKFNSILTETQKLNIDTVLSLLRNVFLNFFFSDLNNNKDLENLYLFYADKNDNYKQSKKVNYDTKYIYPQSLLDTELEFSDYITHIFKKLKEHNYITIFNSCFDTKQYSLTVKNDLKQDYLKNIEIINENLTKIFNNMSVIIDYIEYIVNDNKIPAELNPENLNINNKQFTIKLCIYFIYYILIYIDLIKEYIYNISELNRKFDESTVLDKKFLNFMFWIFNTYDDNEYFKSCFNNYDYIKMYLFTFFNIISTESN